LPRTIRSVRPVKAGARGYLLEDDSLEQLLQAIYDVHRGRSSLHPSIALKVIRELSHPPHCLPQSHR
jgi:NarL family two-component system response regulator LiaR